MSEVTHQESTVEQIRRLVTQVTERDLSNQEPGAPLNLDSIERITLIVDLENHFSIEIPEGEVQPEIFASLASLAAAVEALRP